MRTTLALDEDAFILARQTAQRSNVSLGKAVSMLIRQSTLASAAATAPKTRSPFALIPNDGHTVVASHDVYRIMEQEGI